jgi:acetylornithine deacetylase/succinyl-diaminopimelate desuccinylase-like protein
MDGHAPAASRLDTVLARQDADFDAALERLNDLLRIRSISTDPAYKADCLKAAESLAAELNGLGFDARVAPTTGHPMVVAHHDGASADAPHVLFYGHYDVQPVDPIELWEADPFDPEIKTRADGSKFIRARGAADDKGQLRTFIEACRAWKEETGTLPCRVTIFFEGEEETGSPSLEAWLTEHGEELKADFALVCDTNMWDRTTPAITASLRGMSAGEVVIKAASRDLHSGLYGGAARNPITLLAQILGQLHDADGRVVLPGFYDGVEDAPAEVIEQWKQLGFSEERFLGDVGLSKPAGEKGRMVLEQIWTRPTAEINGIIGGYTGEGFKTVIPAKASAKVSFRLVAGQDPEKVWKAFEKHVTDRLPEDCEAVFNRRDAGAPALNVDVTNPALQACVDALRDEWETEPALMGSGGSIPIVGDFKRHLGMDTILAGFGLEDDNIHSPNEKYELESFRKGIRSWARILDRLAAKG